MIGFKRNLPPPVLPTPKRTALSKENSENELNTINTLEKKVETKHAAPLIELDVTTIENYKNEVRKALATPYVTEGKRWQNLVPTDFKHPTTFDWKNPKNASKYEASHDGGKQAINVHAVPLAADAKIWEAGTWFVLLPNWLKAQFELKAIMAAQAIRNKYQIVDKRLNAEKDKDLLTVIKCLQPLLNIYTMCKIGIEHLSTLSLNINNKDGIRLVLDSIQNIILEQIIDSSFETRVHHIKARDENGYSSLNTEKFKEISGSFNMINGDQSIIVVENWLNSTSLKNTQFSNTLLNCIQCLKNNDLTNFLNMFLLKAHEKDLVAAKDIDSVENNQNKEPVVVENLVSDKEKTPTSIRRSKK